MQPDRLCKNDCGETLRRPEGISENRWAQWRFCSRWCANSYRTAGKPKLFVPKAEPEKINLPPWPIESPLFEDVSAERLRREMPYSVGPRLVIPPRRDQSYVGNGTAMCASRGDPA